MQNERRERSIGDGESPTQAIIEAAAVLKNVEPVDLPPLYSYVDCGSLDTLLSRDDYVEVRFTYSGLDVTATPRNVHVEGGDGSEAR